MSLQSVFKEKKVYVNQTATAVSVPGWVGFFNVTKNINYKLHSCILSKSEAICIQLK